MNQMKRVVVVLRTDNAAFADDADTEVARVLRTIASKFAAGNEMDGYKIRDVNGNNVGAVRVEYNVRDDRKLELADFIRELLSE